MLVPWIVPSYVVAVLWSFMWQSDVGIVNKLLVDYTHLLGDRPVWLLGPNTMWAIVIPSIWRGLPLAMLIFLAGLQAMPRELHEAAAIDGANAWRRFWDITWPLLRPTVAAATILSLIFAFKNFDLIWIATKGGPANATTTLPTLAYQTAFEQFLFGRGAAILNLIFVACFVLALGYIFSLRREERVA
jgi:multiple sugar transport system permease protein